MAVSPPRLLVDPSLFLSEESVAWLERNEGARSGIVISATFNQLLSTESERVALPFLPREEWGLYPYRRERLNSFLPAISTFSYGDSDLPGPVGEIGRTLRASNEPVGMILADEWAYLQSQSWMATRLRLPLDAFRDAGAAVVEYGRRVRDQFIQAVITTENIPPVITTPYFLTRVAPKWIVLGGAAAGGGLLGFAVGGPAGSALGGFAAGPIITPFVRAFDP